MLRFLTAGESHGPCLVVIVEGLPSGLKVEEGAIDRDLRRRQGGYGRGGRMALERDRAEILSGVLRGQTTGAPVALRIENKDARHLDELPPLTVPRPGHADYSGMVKYGLNDARPVLERASARETAARVAAGALAKLLLAEFDIVVGSYVAEIGGVTAAVPDLPPEEIWERAEADELRCPDEEAARKMRAAIDAASAAGDSVGGVFVVMATGLPVGLGSYVHWDRRLDARLAGAVMSIPAVKGVEIGPAFENARRRGRDVHDELFPAENGPTRRTNRAGGLEGGITNGMPLVVRAAMKPIPTTLAPLRSVDMRTGQAATTEYQRSDICAVPAAAVVGEAMVAWVLAEALLEKLGGDSLSEMKFRFNRRGTESAEKF
ncbi:MAG: chorismate synthase [Anaerolineae bacterium]